MVLSRVPKLCARVCTPASTLADSRGGASASPLQCPGPAPTPPPQLSQSFWALWGGAGSLGGRPLQYLTVPSSHPSSSLNVG